MSIMAHCPYQISRLIDNFDTAWRVLDLLSSCVTGTATGPFGLALLTKDQLGSVVRKEQLVASFLSLPHQLVPSVEFDETIGT